ncbi:MAG: HAD-IIA family hydrolase [Ruminococcaceae bacterium]|nr:HAD-IIA family hydrolase [Oscillospiraceae bacterium]
MPKDKKLFLLDMDGTLYLGDRLFDCTLPFLESVKKSGGKYLFLTNNSSKSAASYVEKLKKLGIDAAEDDFVTSVNATSDYLLKHHKYEKIYAFGTASFRKELAENRLCITTEPTDDVSVLVIGFDTELTFEKLEHACILLNRGVTFIATNPDWVCPTVYGSVPDCGSVCEMLYRATGKRPRVIGKPQPDMVYMALSKEGFAPEDALLIGDRLYTDIACGNAAGIDTAFVLSGEGTLKDIEETGVVPTYILQDVGQIFSPSR